MTMPTNWMSDTAWHAARRMLITATDSPAILGVSPFKSAMQVYAAKTGSPVEVPDNDRMYFGRLLEPVVADAYADRTGRKVSFPPERLSLHPTIPWLGASLDRIVEDKERGRGVLEIKTTGMRIEDELPIYWQVQVMHQLAVSGLSWASMGILVAGQTFIVRDLERNDEFIEALLAKLETFWQQHVEARVPPATDGSESCRKALLALYPRDDGETVSLPAEADEWIARLDEANTALKAASALKREMQNRIGAAIGDATFGVTPGGARFSYKLQHRAAHEVKASECRVLRRLRARRAGA